jgi:hypothetical protein
VPLVLLLLLLFGNLQGYRRYNRAEISALVEVQRELSRRDSHDLDEDPLVCLHKLLLSLNKCADNSNSSSSPPITVTATSSITASSTQCCIYIL